MSKFHGFFYEKWFLDFIFTTEDIKIFQVNS